MKSTFTIRTIIAIIFMCVAVVFPGCKDDGEQPYSGGGSSSGGGTEVYEWINYDTENSDLINNWVTFIAIDANGDKWVGTYDGISVLKTK